MQCQKYKMSVYVFHNTANSGVPASENVIVAHADFRMFVLANRPGFPFLGNDFFGAMGKLCTCSCIPVL